jgi:hypothetical protein
MAQRKRRFSKELAWFYRHRTGPDDCPRRYKPVADQSPFLTPSSHACRGYKVLLHTMCTRELMDAPCRSGCHIHRQRLGAYVSPPVRQHVQSCQVE